MNAALSADVLDRLRWVLDLTGGTAREVIDRQLAAKDLDDESQNQTFGYLTGDDREERAQALAQCFDALHFAFETIGRDAKHGRLHVRWFGPLDEDGERLAIIIAGSYGVRLTKIERACRPAPASEWYHGGPDRVFGVVTDGALVHPVSDRQRAYEKAFRAKRLISANNAAGKDTLVEVSLIENASNPNADVIAPMWGGA